MWRIIIPPPQHYYPIPYWVRVASFRLMKITLELIFSFYSLPRRNYLLSLFGT